jgi:hypothetical protein
MDKELLNVIVKRTAHPKDVFANQKNYFVIPDVIIVILVLTNEMNQCNSNIEIDVMIQLK